MSHPREAAELMRAFVVRTGVVGDRPSHRYLWTDAFAVCNLLGLAASGELNDGVELARRLVDRVHDTLGRHDPAHGDNQPLGGRDEETRRQAPTSAGLRIGKPLPQRRPDEPPDPRLEWERDGQYFHYLTRWMHALARLAEETGDLRYHDWAVGLADAAFGAFVGHDRQHADRMVWKMSVDLDRVLVASMGLHDPLDGWITSLELASSAFTDPRRRARLLRQAEAYRSLCEGSAWSSPDPLGIGGLLADAWRWWRSVGSRNESVPVRLLDAARVGLVAARSRGLARGPVNGRLAFRELGLAIGLHAAERLAAAVGADGEHPGIEAALSRLSGEARLGQEIENTWRRPANRDGPTWRDHRDINEVMLATSLAPEGYLGRAPVPAAGPQSERIQ